MRAPARAAGTQELAIDCYAADPRQDHVLDPGFHRVHPVELVSGAQVVFEVYDHTTSVGLRLDFTHAGDPQGHLSGRVLLDHEAADSVASVCRYFHRHQDAVGQAEVYVYNDGFDWYGSYGDGREPDVRRVLHVGRTGPMDAMVYLRLDLIETHGIAPTVWLDRDQLREVGNTASELAGEM